MFSCVVDVLFPPSGTCCFLSLAAGGKTDCWVSFLIKKKKVKSTTVAAFDKQGHRYENTGVLLLLHFVAHLHKTLNQWKKSESHYVHLKLQFTLCSKTFKENIH